MSTGNDDREQIERLVRMESMLMVLTQQTTRLVAMVEGDGQTGLLGRVAHLETLVTDKVKRTYEAVFGNGKPGLNERVGDVEKGMQAAMKIVYPLAISMVLALFGFLWALLTNRIEILAH